MSVPHRRHRLVLDLEADSLDELVGVLHYLADEIEVEGRDQRVIRASGYSSTYTSTLSTIPLQTEGNPGSAPVV
jgi:hypothetical protein